jgi:hypothetical protein
VLSTSPGFSQAPGSEPEIPIDRWLVSDRLEVSSGVQESSADPLLTRDGVAFPDRDLVVGPSYWTLVREDGVRGLDARTVLAVLGEAGEASDEASILTHVYLKAPEDRAVLLDLGADECQSARAWLNGQPIQILETPAYARLAGGWNTLVVRLREAERCPPALSAALLPSSDLDPETETAPGLAGIRVQASRPPGVRRHHPEGWVGLGPVYPGPSLFWQAGAEDLVGTIVYEYVAWGRSTGSADASEADRGEAEPPAFDVSGRWDLRLIGPTGIQETTADFEMEEDGTLRGEIVGSDREGGVRGTIEDGWVSGDRISFRTRFSMPRARSMDVRLEGTVEEDFISGTIDFLGGGRPTPPGERQGVPPTDARISDFESRFEATRSIREDPEAPGAPEGEEGEGEEGEGDVDPLRPRPDRSRIPDRSRRGGSFGAVSDIASGQVSDEELRRRMRSQLLPPSEPTTPAPSTAAFGLRVAGERLQSTAGGLTPGVVHEGSNELPFKKLRDATLSNDGVRMRVRWTDEELELRRTLAAEHLLNALHAEITLTGGADQGDGTFAGSWRVPDALAGFTLRLVSPLPDDVSVNGTALSGAQPRLCGPCRRGERLEILLRGDPEAEAAGAAGAAGSAAGFRVQIVEPGYPDAPLDSGSPAATEWLRALRGDNKDYHELADRFSGGS